MFWVALTVGGLLSVAAIVLAAWLANHENQNYRALAAPALQSLGAIWAFCVALLVIDYSFFSQATSLKVELFKKQWDGMIWYIDSLYNMGQKLSEILYSQSGQTDILKYQVMQSVVQIISRTGFELSHPAFKEARSSNQLLIEMSKLLAKNEIRDALAKFDEAQHAALNIVLVLWQHFEIAELSAGARELATISNSLKPLLEAIPKVTVTIQRRA
jgi:hypothetical protein